MATGKRRRSGPPPRRGPVAVLDRDAPPRPSRIVGAVLLALAIAALAGLGWALTWLRGPTIERIRELAQGEPHAAMLLTWTLLCTPIWTAFALRAARRTPLLLSGRRRTVAMAAYALAWVPLAMFTPLWRHGPDGLRRDFLRYGYGVAEAMYSGYYAGFVALVGGLAAPLLVLTAIGALPHGGGRTRTLGLVAVAAPGLVAVAALAWEWVQTF